MLSSNLARTFTAAAFLLSPALYAAEPEADARLVLALKQAVRNTPDLYKNLEEKAAKLAQGLTDNCKSTGVQATANRVGSMMTLFFSA